VNLSRLGKINTRARYRAVARRMRNTASGGLAEILYELQSVHVACATHPTLLHLVILVTYYN